MVFPESIKLGNIFVKIVPSENFLDFVRALWEAMFRCSSSLHAFNL